MPPIKTLLQQTDLCAHMTDEAIDTLLASAEQREYATGDIILREGDVADAMYVVIAGAVQVFTEVDDQIIVLAKRETGDFFGEQALLPGRTGRRNASVRSYNAARLLRIDKTQFQRLLHDDDPLKERLLVLGDQQVRERLAQQTSLFRTLGRHYTTAQADEEFFQPGDVIFREGDEADKLYIILRGSVGVYRNEAGQQVLLDRLEAGQCFGELGLVTRQPRAATVVAEDDLHVLAFHGQRFLELYAHSPDMREYVQTLQRVYQLPGLGEVSQHNGHFMDHECITTHYTLLDGRQFIASQVVGQQIYNLEQVSETQDAGPGQIVRSFHNAETDESRQIRLSPDGHIQGMTVLGHWAELPSLHMKAIQGELLPAAWWEDFERSGFVIPREILPAEAETDTVCTCVQVQRQRIRAAILTGCDRLPALQQRLGCGTVCGACIPSILEMLGQQGWTPVTIIETMPVADQIRTFRLQPVAQKVQPARPGQHIVVQGRINNVWVQRAYTLSSACDETDYYEITVKREALGVFSCWLFDQPATSSLLRVSQPQGTYYWEPRSTPVVCLVAGIGLTPALSICRTLQRRGLANDLYIHYSARHSSDFAYVDELKTAAATHPHITLTLRETAREGRLTQGELNAVITRYADAEYFLCGPEPYLDSMTQMLRAGGVPKARIHVEVFTHAGDPVRTAASPPVEQRQVQAPPPLHQSNLLVDPQPVVQSTLKQTLFGMMSAIHSAVNATANDWHHGQRRPHFLLALFDSLATGLSGADPTLPRDYLGMLGEPGKGSLNHLLYCFDRAATCVGANKREALTARARGTSLPSSTPDGDTVVFTVPTMSLAQFVGEHAVDTGWTTADDHWMMPLHLVKGRAALKTILGQNPNFERGPIPYHYLQQALGCPAIHPTTECKAAAMFGGQLFNNTTWDHDRAFVSDMFSFSALTPLGDGLEVALSNIIEEIEHHMATTPERIVDLNVMTTRIAYRMILQASFGNVALDEFVVLGSRLTELMRQAFNFIQEFVTSHIGDFQILYQAIDEAKKAVGQMLEIIRHLHAQGTLSASSAASPLVQLMLHGEDGQPWSVDRLFSLVFPVIFGGHETTGYTLAWALYEMGRDPELAATIRREIDTFQQRHEGEGIRPARYTERPYTLALLFETLRLHPPTVLIPRTAMEAGEMPPDPDTGIGAFRYRKGAVFFCAVAAAHLDPEVYPDPWTFRIERFFAGYTPGMSVEEHGDLVWTNARHLEADQRFMPFGGGRGSCPGRGFNMLEFFLVLDALLSRFVFELVEPQRKVKAHVEIISGPEPGKLGGRIRRRT